MRITASFICALALIASNKCATGQSLSSLAGWDSPYPNAVLVSPQDSSFVAPGIYRSVSRTRTLNGPTDIVQICVRDFRETNALKTLYSGISEAAGLEETIHKNFGAKLAGINLKILSVGGEIEIKDEASFTAAPLRVLSADDDISDVVLANIQDGCRAIIRNHLRQGRLVFIAAKAIQAKDFVITFARGPKGSASASCAIPFLCSADTGLSGSIDRQVQRKKRAVQPVTFALVPAELSNGRRTLLETDLK